MAIVNSDKNVPKLKDRLTDVKVIETEFEYVVELEFERSKRIVAHLCRDKTSENCKNLEKIDKSFGSSIEELVNSIKRLNLVTEEDRISQRLEELGLKLETVKTVQVIGDETKEVEKQFVVKK